MPAQEFHDYKIQRFDWRLSERILNLELEGPLINEKPGIQFVGVFGWHLDDAAEGCTVFSLKEIEADRYLAEDQRYIQSMKNGCFSNVVDAVQSGEGRIWSLKSSYGMCGYIVAKDCRETS